MRTLLLVFAVACNSTPATSLHGTVGCTDNVGSDIVCGDGQLCISGRGEPDDGSIPPMCTTLEAGCSAFDCMGAGCPACILKLCPYYPDYVAQTQLAGRTLRCP